MIWDELAVLITSHPKQQKYWQQALGSWRDYPHYILMGNDDDTWEGIPLDNIMPPVKDLFLTKYKAGYLGHFRGELEQMQIGGRILAEKGYKYIYKTAADNTCYRWRNLINIQKVLKKKDFIICGTTQIFGNLKKFNKAMELWHPKLRSGGAELYFYSQIRAYEMNVIYKKGPWWNKILGLIHVQGEHAINTDKNIVGTWVDGHVWKEDYKHRDIVPGRAKV